MGPDSDRVSLDCSKALSARERAEASETWCVVLPRRFLLAGRDCNWQFGLAAPVPKKPGAQSSTRESSHLAFPGPVLACTRAATFPCTEGAITSFPTQPL